MTRRLMITMVLLGAALALLGAACGGSDNNSSSGGTTTTEGTTTEATTTSGGGGTASGTLQGETGPGFTIEVKQNGKDAEEVKAGTYTLKVEDKSDMHNFHLIGPGVDQEVTTVSFTGDKEVTVTLKPGTYTYQCDPHASAGMKGTFKVT
jgi:plastocyanin